MNRLRGQYRGARPSSQRNVTQQPTQADEPLDYLMEVDPEVEEMATWLLFFKKFEKLFEE